MRCLLCLALAIAAGAGEPLGSTDNHLVSAAGLVIASSWHPAGVVYTSPRLSGPGYHLDAEDLVVAVDATSGHLVWRHVSAGARSIAGQFRVGPVVVNDLVVAIGTSGRLVALEAATGTVRWRAHLGPAHHAATRALARDRSLAAQGHLAPPRPCPWTSNPIACGGILVVPTFQGRDGGLRGLDPADGETRWQVDDVCSHVATPQAWFDGQRDWLVAATSAGTLTLLDPADGRVAWRRTGLAAQDHNLAIAGDRLLVASRTGWRAWRLTASQAVDAWRYDGMTATPRWALAAGDRLALASGHELRLLAAEDGQVLATATIAETGAHPTTWIAGHQLVLSPAPGTPLQAWNLSDLTPAPAPDGTLAGRAPPLVVNGRAWVLGPDGSPVARYPGPALNR